MVEGGGFRACAGAAVDRGEDVVDIHWSWTVVGERVRLSDTKKDVEGRRSEVIAVMGGVGGCAWGTSGLRDDGAYTRRYLSKTATVLVSSLKFIIS